MGKKSTVEETEKNKNKNKNKKTGNNSLCQVNSFTKDAGSKEGSNIIFQKRWTTLKPIRTIKFYLETLKIKEMSKNQK